jgi:DNA-binding IclR family transcriptional regulator
VHDANANDAAAGPVTRTPSPGSERADGHHRTIQSVDRAMALLRLLGARGGELSLSDFVRATGLHKSTTHRLLASLQEAGLIGRDAATGRYELNLELVALAGVVLGRLEVLRIADPHLRRLADVTEKTVNLAIRHQHDVVNVEQIPGPRILRSFDWLGKRTPLHLGAASKALLAHLTDEELAAHLDYANAQAANLDPAGFWAEMREIRRRGVAVNRGELEPDVYAVGAPIFGADARPRASISVAGHREEYGDAQIGGLEELVIDTAEAVSRQMGYRVTREARMA